MKHCPLAIAAGLAALASSCAPLPPPPGEDPYYPRQRQDYPRPYESETPEAYERRYESVPPRQETPAPAQEKPVARKTDNPNQVISPYPPYNLIDVTGFRSGQLAKDPSNQKIFRVP